MSKVELADSVDPDMAVRDQANARPAQAEWAGLAAKLVNSDLAWRLLSVALFIGVWEIFALVNREIRIVNPLFMVPPHVLLHTASQQWQEGVLWGDVKASLGTAAQGYVIGCTAGLVSGILSGYILLVQRLWDPIVQIFRSIPPLAFLPMFILYLGIGELSRVLFIAYAVYFYTYLNAMQGVRHIDPLLIRAALSLGATRQRIFRSIILPGAMPSVMTGLRVSAGMALFVLVAAELIAADQGIGYRIMWARQYFQVDTMLFDAFLIGFLGFTIDSIMRRIEAWILRWKPQVGDSR
jgi:ABC-type nitrate/sulfonate/bicarbonate transport system permease component